jgi:hypothetical protein
LISRKRRKFQPKKRKPLNPLIGCKSGVKEKPGFVLVFLSPNYNGTFRRQTGIGKHGHVFDSLWHNANADGTLLRHDRISMDFLANLSWREILAAVVVLLVIYILFTYLRLSRLGDETRLAQELSSGVMQSAALESYVEVQKTEKTENVKEEIPAAPADVALQLKSGERARSRKGQTFAWNEPPSENPERYRIDVLEQDLAQLRREIGGLRAEVQTLREEQQREMSRGHEAQNISPFYSDAMQLAMQGREADDISALCGISRAEAELVVALARNSGQAID